MIPINRDHSSPTACRLMISGTISLPSPGYFSTFIHITCALSVVSEYLVLGRGRPGFLWGFPCPIILGILLGYFRISLTRLSLSLAWLSSQFSYPSISLDCSPATPYAKSAGFRLFPFRSPLLGKSHSLSFPQGTEMVQFPWFDFSHLF